MATYGKGVSIVSTATVKSSGVSTMLSPLTAGQYADVTVQVVSGTLELFIGGALAGTLTAGRYILGNGGEIRQTVGSGSIIGYAVFQNS